MTSRIDIRIDEAGTDVTTRAIEKVADAIVPMSREAAMSLRGVALRVGISTDKLVKEVASAVLDRVVHATPHDTGAARGNWTPVVSTSPPALTPLPEKTDYEGDSTVAAGTAYIQTTPRAPGQSVYISNVLPYIEALNNGHSQQAPAAGFVELATQVGAKVASDANALKRGLK